MDTMQIGALMSIYRLGKMPNDLEFCQVAVLGIAQEADPHDPDGYQLVFGHRNFNVPLVEYEVFLGLTDMYPPELRNKVKSQFEITPKNTLERNVKQVRGWEHEALTEEQIRGNVREYT